MLLPSYVFIAVAALIANCRDWRMLGLSLLVAANVLVPIPSATAEMFYSTCILAELIVILGALLLRATASIFVAELAIVLIMAHIMGYVMDGSSPLSPYRIIVKICEYSELILCVAFSPVLYTRLRNRPT